MTAAKRTPARIAVRFPNWIGDAVMATPVLRSLRSGYPESRIDVIAAERVASLVQSDPHIDSVLSIPDNPTVPGGYLRAGAAIRNGRYDLGLILPDSFGSALLFFLAGIGRRIGYAAELRGSLLTGPIRHGPDPRSEHLTIGYLRLAEIAGGKPVTPEPAFYSRPEEDDWVEKLLTELGSNGSRPLIGMVPGATYGPAKRWPAGSYRQVVREAVDAGWKVLLLGGLDDGETVHDILRDSPPENVHNLLGRTDIRQTATLMKRLDVVLTNDTGPMHLAASVGTMVIGLFGSTNPVWTGPRGPKRMTFHGAVPCSPCYLRRCPYDLECFKLIEPDYVTTALRTIVDDREE